MEDLAALLNNAEAIDERDVRYKALLSDLQCNILSGHGRKEARYFFLRFDDPIKAKYLCGMLARSPVERAMVFTTQDERVLEKLPKGTRDVLGLDKAGPWLLPPEQYERIQHIVLDSEQVVRARNVEKKERRRLEEEMRKRGGGGGGAVVDADPNDFVVNLLFTASGYRKLTDEALPSDASFRLGMAERGKALNDPTSEAWDEGLVGVDALLIVAYDPCSEQKAKAAQDAALKTLESALEKHGRLVGESQVGRALTVKLGEIWKGGGAPDKDVAIEAFGFRDGISQPVFYADDIVDLERKGVIKAALPAGLAPESDEARKAQERARQAAFAPLRLTLCADPNGRTRHACGTYFVFRKLGQDIEKFYEQVNGIAAEVGRDQEDVLADLMGRRRDGAPLARKPGAGINTFDYRDDDDNDGEDHGDQEGKRCPFHSHVRKVNPRRDLPDKGREQRIVRRGMPYGPPIERDASGKPTFDKKGKIKRQEGAKPKKNDIGLLFMCAQSSIEKQFERIQSDWANNPNFAWGKLPGADPVAGQQGANAVNRIHVHRANKDLPEREFVTRQVVTMCGGDYFFAPSISFLRSLHDGLWK